MTAAAETLTPPAGKKPRKPRSRQRVDDLPVRIGGMEYARTASTPARAPASVMARMSSEVMLSSRVAGRPSSLNRASVARL